MTSSLTFKFRNWYLIEMCVWCTRKKIKKIEMCAHQQNSCEPAIIRRNVTNSLQSRLVLCLNTGNNQNKMDSSFFAQLHK